MVQQNNLKETFNSELLSEYISQEKPLDRVKRLYKKNEQTTRYYEEAKVCEVISLFISTTVGSAAFALSAPLCRENYISANVATVYDTKVVAMRRAKDAYMFGGLKRFAKWTLLTYAVVFSFSNLSQALELYRCETNIAHYTVSGVAVGAISRLILGPRAMLAGGFIGGYMGTMTGFAATNIMTWAGINIEQRFYEEMERKLIEKKCYEESRAKALAQLALGGGSETTHKAGTPV
ncbi:TIMMDC1 [Bugula neritina]|uniref:Complex I assembly factor TIMMDC1, mitochondrial n=1 Tax=Bugula neritina TaxID=10212 RepID=A0A7J7ISD8_BUGNE|nr:TIMMDC1 [Bugula neritina]